MKRLILLILATAITSLVNAQTDTLVVKTSVICEECKERIEHDLSFEKGVKSNIVNLDTKEVTVVYNSAKTDPQKIRLAITKIGYDADTLKADEKAFNKLPLCCRVPGHEN
jgi:mercuric ion binding protein